MKLQVIIQTLTCRKHHNLRDVLNAAPFCTLYLKSCIFLHFIVSIILFLSQLPVWCERNKIPIVFVLCTFSKHKQEVGFGIQVLDTVSVCGGELGSPVSVLVPSEDIGTHYINNRMAQWRSWVSNIRPWTFIRSTPALIQKALACSHNAKVKSNTVSLITVWSQRGSAAVLAAVHHSKLFPLLSGSTAEQRSQRHIEGCYTHRRTLQQQERLKVAVFRKIIDKKLFFVSFLLFFFFPRRWPSCRSLFYMSSYQMTLQGRRTRTLPGAFYIMAARLVLFFFSHCPKKAFR